jgi:regulator of protease activity HflC (stomatin/prohibitin superfamily)
MEILLQIIGFGGVLPVVIIFLLSGIRIIDQYERGLVLTLGKFTSMRSPGLNWIFPVIQKMVKVDMRIATVDIPQQEVITRDNVPLNVNAVVYYKIEDAEKAILNIQDYATAVADFAQVALCDVVGGFDLDQVLSEREEIANKIKDIVDKTTTEWGIDISAIKLQDIELPADMKRIMAKQAESERDRRAQVIRAEGELEASKKLAEAAKLLAETNGGLAMRTLQTIEKSQGNTIWALPTEVLSGIAKLGNLK